MKQTYRTKAYFILLAVMAGLSMSAGISTFTSKLQGAFIYNNAVVNLKDDQYDYMLANPTWSTVFKNNAVSNRVRLKNNGNTTTHYASYWFVQAILSVDAWDASGTALTTQQCTLKVEYNPAAQSTYTDVSTFLHSNAHRVKITVVNITSSFSGNTVPEDVMLEAEMEIDRSFAMNPSQAITISNSSNACTGTGYNTNNDVEFHWDYLLGAEEYDLEWVFKSDYDANTTVDYTNATRITTSNQYFKLNLLFDNGKIYYRIRGIARDFATGTKRLEGNWTNGAAPIIVCNMEHRNWTYQASYAEDGKKKEVVAYFDGSQRNRQTVTLSNTENVSLITENIYDYEGRPAIQTLPAPSKDYKSNLLFYQNLNLNPSAAPYSKKDFDKDALFSSCVPGSIPGMLSTVPGSGTPNMGSSYYYSDQNALALATNGFAAAIPDAQDYPFTQTVYSSKGEPRYQSGVGPVHKIGGGHETQYISASASQEKLDRLFGNEVGYAEHYTENITIDANGQISVAYKDLSGKVIATALRGNSPTNLNGLNSKANPGNDDEPYIGAEAIYENFSSDNKYIASGEAYVIEKDFPVTNTSTSYVFSYKISPQVFQSLCTSTDFNCKYILTITIVDECGNTLTENTPSSPSILNTPHAIDAGSYISSPYQLNFTVSFPRIGIYKITKTLKLDQAALQQYVIDYENYLRNPEYNSCIDNLSDLQEEYEAGVDMNECEDCEWNCDNNAPASFPYTDPNGTVFNTLTDFLAACKADCKVKPEPKDCNALLQNLKDDMSPGGQYFNANVPAGTYYIGSGGGYITVSSTMSFIDFVIIANGPFYVLSDFETQFANYALMNGCSPPPSNMTMGDIAANWDPCWAGFLVKFHPEYCRYQRCMDLRSSSDFNATLLSLDYTEATTLPTTTSPYLTLTTPVGNSVRLLDPYFTTVKPSDATSIAAEIANCTSCSTWFVSPHYTPPSSTSMWDWAAVAPLPITSTPGTTAYNNDRWANFLKLYLNVKTRYERNYGCPAQPDATNPPDYVSDLGAPGVLQYQGNYSIALNQMHINDPDPMAVMDYLASSPSNTVTYTGLASDACVYTGAAKNIGDFNSDGITPASTGSGCSTNANCTSFPVLNPALADGECAYVFYVYLPNVPVNLPTNASSVSGPGCWIQISSPVTFPANWLSPALTPAQADLNYQILKASIDNYVSNPYDFVCQLNYSGGHVYSYKILAPASLGLQGNSAQLKVIKVCNSHGTNTSSDICLGTFSGATKDCNPSTVFPDCICSQLNQIATVYNDANYGVNHTTYPTLASYAAVTLTQAYELTTPLTTAQVQFWIDNCSTNSNGTPLALDANGDIDLTNSGNTTYAVPAPMDCNPEEPCQEQGIDEADFYASEQFDFQVAQEVQNFIQQYKASCMNKAALAEEFKVEYDEKEYHYTLYYYDQAGNLVRTVPPKAVNRLAVTTMYSGTTNLVHQARLANSGFIYPTHNRTTNTFVTNYKYNTLDQLVEQQTPDGGTTKFWYNDIGQLKFSQNSKQLAAACMVCGPYYAGRYSYTIYDGQGRITEVGENEQNYFYKKTVGGILTSFNEPFYNAVNVPSFPDDDGWQVTKTYYDQALAANPVNTQFTGSAQQLLRKRVASVTIEETEDTDDNTYDHATHYSYDVHGNVTELVQENPSLASITQSYKKMQYKYDLISGNVNEASYQKGMVDQFHHRYYYDANNRVISAQTSNDYVHWQQDARYFYYLHGPLARTELGDDKVQGLDYVYTLQGWIKNVNSNTLQNYNDPGMDSYTGYAYLTGQNNLHKNMGKDVFGYSLDYYNQDYEAIKTTLTGAITGNLASSAIYAASSNLYNGNIKGMSTAMYQPNGTALPSQMTTVAKFYAYDQLNRVQEAQTYLATAHSFASLSLYGTPSTSDYYEFFRYDPNGNIKKAKRNGYTAAQVAMEDLTYNYASSNNQLLYVGDGVLTDPYTDDITNQSSGNYSYDAIGNLIADASEQIANIEWTVYGKIKRITRTSTSTKPDLEFLYDASGNRVYKLEKPRNGSGYVASTQWKHTYYVRDAQGNVMAVYDKYLTHGNLRLRLTEHHLYGSTRLGIESKGIDMQSAPPSGTMFAGLKGKKYYELTNHLGNVLLTISDRKLSISAGSGGLSTGYLPEVLSATDYYVFGAPMPGRNYNNNQYRYGMNGQEKDDEIFNGAYTAEYWEYDSRLGRRWNTDPVDKPWMSPYHAFSNRPIWNVDPNGASDAPPDKILHDDNGGEDRYVKDENGTDYITEEWGHYTNDEKTGFVSRVSVTPEDKQIVADNAAKIDQALSYSRNMSKAMDQFEKGFAITVIAGVSLPLLPYALPVVGEGGAGAYFGGAVLRTSIDAAAQMAANNGDVTKLDVGDALMSGFLTPGGSAVLGGAVDIRPFAANDQPVLKVVGVNKDVSEAAFDAGAKYIFGRSGPIGSQYGKLGGAFGNLAGNTMSPLITAPFNLGGKIATKEAKKAIFGK